MSAAAPAPEPKPVDVAAIERELAGLWRELAAEPGARAGEPAAESPVTRACMSNLLIFARSHDEANPIPSEIADIVVRHPARVILLVGEDAGPRGAAGATAGLQASVTAVCHLAGGGRQICSEHVTLEAAPGARDRLPPTTRSLVLGDLPTALWWAAGEPPTLSGDLFLDLAAMADHVIYDSAGWLDPVRGVIAIADWATGLASRQVVSDLAWRRGKPWRRLVAQTLDPGVAPGALAGIEEVVIEHGPHALPQAWLTIGWLAGRLGWQPVGGEVVLGDHVSFGFSSERGPLRVTVKRLPEGPATLRSIAVAWRGGSAAASGSARFVGSEAGLIVAETGPSDVLDGAIVAPFESRAALVARQLPKRFRDPLFRDALALSRRMATAIAR